MDRYINRQRAIALAAAGFDVVRIGFHDLSIDETARFLDALLADQPTLAGNEAELVKLRESLEQNDAGN